MGSGNITIIAVFMAGVLSFLSPCVLPLLPTFSAMLAGSVDGEELSTYKIYLNTCCFLLGFTIIFIAMGVTASLIGQWFFDYQPVLKKIGAVMIIIMGGLLAGVFRIPTLQREYKPFMCQGLRGPLGAFLLGTAYTIGWTPCTGPILATVLLYAGGRDTVMQGALLLLVYAIGFSVPFFMMAAVLRKYIFTLRKFYEWLPAIQRFAGVLLILVGIMVWLNWVEKGLGILTSFF